MEDKKIIVMNEDKLKKGIESILSFMSDEQLTELNEALTDVIEEAKE